MRWLWSEPRWWAWETPAGSAGSGYPDSDGRGRSTRESRSREAIPAGDRRQQRGAVDGMSFGG